MKCGAADVDERSNTSYQPSSGTVSGGRATETNVIRLKLNNNIMDKKDNRKEKAEQLASNFSNLKKMEDKYQRIGLDPDRNMSGFSFLASPAASAVWEAPLQGLDEKRSRPFRLCSQNRTIRLTYGLLRAELRAENARPPFCFVVCEGAVHVPIAVLTGPAAWLVKIHSDRLNQSVTGGRLPFYCSLQLLISLDIGCPLCYILLHITSYF
ncbi:hypothetical protein JXO52_10465 [bacterium]|nr:hypothetical protein [bacterium]